MKLTGSRRVQGLLPWLSCLIVILAAGSRGMASELGAQEIASELQNKYDATRSLKADFEQISSSEYLDKKRLGTGSMIIQKPGFIRWDYYLPERQVLTSDGQTLTMYFEKSKQLMRSAAEQYLQSDVTYSFFTGKGNINKDFDISEPDGGVESLESAYCIKLKPKKPHPQIDFLHLWVNKKDFIINRILMTDHLGSTTEIRFTNLIINPEIPLERFSFIPPAGTEILEQDGEVGGVGAQQ